MKKNWNILMMLLLLCFSGGLLGSCTDEMEGNSTSGSDKITVRVQFSTKADGGSAATDPEKLNDNEYRIRSIRLYAFDGEILDNMVYKSGLDDVTGVATVDIDVVPADNKTFYVVVNEPDNTAIHSALALANHPNGIKQVQYSMADYLNSDINALTKSGNYFLPMYKEQNADISKTSTDLTIVVDRVVARIDVYMMEAVGVTTTARTDNATLKVERSNDSGYIATDYVKPTDPSLGFDVKNPVVEETLFGSKRIYSFYVPEQTCPDEAHRLKFTLGGIIWGGHEMSEPYNSFYLGNDSVSNSSFAVLNKITRNTVYAIFCSLKPTTKDVTFNVVTMPWGVAPTQSEQTEKEPINMVNCYMSVPGGSVTIPVQNVYRFWSWSDDLPDPEPIPKEMEVVPEVIWTDTEDLITSVELLDIPNLTDKKDHARIRVHTAPGKQGNAVIGMRMKAEDGTLEPDYRWSWHVWVTDYNPSNQNITIKDVTIMDRHLGALTNRYDQEGTVQGLNYQWGRKDAFPTQSRWIGSEMQFGKSIILEEVKEQNNLANAIHNPHVFYYNSDYVFGDWYTINSGNQNSLLWQENKKTIYDPCPEGWKVPSIDSDIWSGIKLNTPDWQRNNKGILSSTLGYFPFTSTRDFSTGLSMQTDFHTGLWFACIDVLGNPQLAKYLVYNSSQDPNQGSACRAMGYSVRCVKE